MGNNEHPIGHGSSGSSIWPVLQLSIKQHQGSHHEYDIYKEQVKQTSLSMWRMGVNCNRQAGGPDNYLTHCLPRSPFIEGEQLMPVSTGAVCGTQQWSLDRDAVSSWLCNILPGDWRVSWHQRFDNYIPDQCQSSNFNQISQTDHRLQKNKVYHCYYVPFFLAPLPLSPLSDWISLFSLAESSPPESENVGLYDAAAAVAAAAAAAAAAASCGVGSSS